MQGQSFRLSAPKSLDSSDYNTGVAAMVKF